MSTNARWIVGLLLVCVIGLGVALLIVAGDNGDDGGGETSVETVTGETTEAPATTEVPTAIETLTTPTTPTAPDGSGGVPAP